MELNKTKYSFQPFGQLDLKTTITAVFWNHWLYGTKQDRLLSAFWESWTTLPLWSKLVTGWPYWHWQSAGAQKAGFDLKLEPYPLVILKFCSSSSLDYIARHGPQDTLQLEIVNFAILLLSWKTLIFLYYISNLR